MNWIPRDAEHRLLILAASFPAVLLTGPRQSGKSSLLRRSFPDAQYITFDDPFQVLRAEGSPKDFVSQLSGQVILDEIQYVPSLFRYLKMAIDEHRVNGRFLLTGSQGFHLGQMGSESLAGRLGIMELPPLGASELRRAHTEASMEEMLFRGGFPEIWSGGAAPTDWYPAYISTYLQRDLRALSQVADLTAFSRFLRALALRAASLLNYADLARDVGISPNTAKHWTSLLVSSGVASPLEGWSANPTSRLVKAPKLYFNDSGLLCALLGFRSARAMLESSLFGAVWETWCFAQIRTWLLNRGRLQGNLYYWRTKDGKEVDFIFEEDRKIHAMEGKAKEIPDAADAQGLALLRRSFKDQEVAAAILCRSPQFVPDAPGLNASLDDCSHLDRIFSV